MATKDTGHLGTIAFGTTGLTYFWRKIGAVEQEGESVEDTDLSDKYFKTFLPGDIPEPGEFEVEYAWNAKVVQPPLGTVETITITLPLAVGGAEQADLAGEGFIMSRTAFPELATNGLQMGKMKVAFSGTADAGVTHGTLPVWTKAT